MVADNNKNSIPDKGTESVIQMGTGDQSKSNHHSFKPRLNKKIILGILVVLLIALGCAWVFTHKVLHVGEKVYAQAAGHRIYKKDIDALKGKANDISDHQTAVALANKYLSEAMAKQYKVEVTSQDIDAASISGGNKPSKYTKQLQVNQAYFNKLQAQNQGIYKGDLLVANFSRYVAYQSPLLREQKAMDANIGNPAAIAADKKYAQEFITNLYNQVKARKITFAQAEQKEVSNPRIGEKAYPTLPHSGAFNTLVSTEVRNGLLQTPSVKQQIANIKSGQTSKPFVVRVANSTSDDSTAESYFLVVRMNSTSGGSSKVDFSQELVQAKQRYGYKIYV